MSTLVLPDLRYKKSFLEALTEYHAEGLYPELHTDTLLKHFPQYLTELELKARGEGLPQNRVQSSTFWLIDSDEYIGRLSIRHYLNEYLLNYGGHIGYDIRPSRRKRGYGGQILGLGLQEAKKIGLERALLTCKETNTASQKIIEKYGGKLEDIRYHIQKNSYYKRYWIEIP